MSASSLLQADESNIMASNRPHWKDWGATKSLLGSSDVEMCKESMLFQISCSMVCFNTCKTTESMRHYEQSRTLCFLDCHRPTSRDHHKELAHSRERSEPFGKWAIATEGLLCRISAFRTPRLRTLEIQIDKYGDCAV